MSITQLNYIFFGFWFELEGCSLSLTVQYNFLLFYPPASEAIRDVANNIEKKTPTYSSNSCRSR